MVSRQLEVAALAKMIARLNFARADHHLGLRTGTPASHLALDARSPTRLLNEGPMLTAITLGLVGFAAGFAARDLISRRRRAVARREFAMGVHRYTP